MAAAAAAAAAKLHALIPPSRRMIQQAHPYSPLPSSSPSSTPPNFPPQNPHKPIHARRREQKNTTKNKQKIRKELPPPSAATKNAARTRLPPHTQSHLPSPLPSTPLIRRAERPPCPSQRQGFYIHIGACWSRRGEARAGEETGARVRSHPQKCISAIGANPPSAPPPFHLLPHGAPFPFFRGRSPLIS